MSLLIASSPRSALYVVDLKKFRKIAAGDRLRGQYQGLSQDPNSLSNLDQVCFYCVWFVLLRWGTMAGWDPSVPGQTSITDRCQWQACYALPSNEAGIDSIKHHWWVETTLSP